ncbi:MAG: hypothetical protein QM755_16445 [Luteolibacter sp.]
MSSRLLLGLAALGSSLLVSCTVYPEGQNHGKKGPRPQETVMTPEQQALQKQREELKKKKEEEEAKKKQEEASGTKPPETTAKTEGGGETSQPKPKQENKKDYPFANPVPGKEGFVFSPYNNKMGGRPRHPERHFGSGSDLSERREEGLPRSLIDPQRFRAGRVRSADPAVSFPDEYGFQEGGGPRRRLARRLAGTRAGQQTSFHHGVALGTP